MSKKIGRNDKCPCGSGKKYKNCCGEKATFSLPGRGVVVKKLRSNKTWSLGDAGVTVYGFAQDCGKWRKVINDITKYIFILYVDLPFLLPLNDEKYEVNIENTKFTIFHKTKKRGEEIFSTLDSNNLPSFSHIRIKGAAFPEDLKGKLFKLKDSGRDEYQKSYILILKILYKINSYLYKSNNFDLQINTPILSYEIFYINKNLPIKMENIEAVSIYPYSGVVRIESSDKRKLINHDRLKTFLSESLKLQNYVEESIIPNPNYKGLSFSERVFLSIHDFLFYCRQHPKVLSKMDEEQIRDLYLIIVKNLFSIAEGEAYNYKGNTAVIQDNILILSGQTGGINYAALQLNHRGIKFKEIKWE